MLMLPTLSPFRAFFFGGMSCWPAFFTHKYDEVNKAMRLKGILKGHLRFPYIFKTELDLSGRQFPLNTNSGKAQPIWKHRNKHLTVKVSVLHQGTCFPILSSALSKVYFGLNMDVDYRRSE